MMFRRRARGASNSGAPEPVPPAPTADEQARSLPAEGSYVTDGVALFRVAHMIQDEARGQLIVELEDCRTLELILCPASTLADMELAPVHPVGVG